ncbi:MAG TPA: isoprenoid biosynthesis glyoxalase ElbB [Phycisphaerales bacterium]|nr:isoprenoid biosynthesis glyoxalase ElbB [Phycisphaerales bacterium]
MRTPPTHPITAAVVLAGCGRGDGSEIHEATSILIHLARLGAQYQCFAPDKPQADVVNHLTGEPAGESRNCLVEAARIARGNVKPIAELRKSGGAGFDCLLFPGGFGAAKNLITFAKDGANATVDPDVEKVFGFFHAAGKPIGLCCIAPVLAAKLLGTERKLEVGAAHGSGRGGVTVTVGDDEGVSGVISQWGSRNKVVPCEQAVVDPGHKVATSPAYMYGDATPWQVYQGIGKMVEETVAMCGKQ